MIVVEHPIMRDGVRLLLQQEPDMEVICETHTLSDIGAQFIRCEPDVTLVDLQTPRGAALMAVSTIHRLSSRAAIVLLATFLDEPDAALRVDGGCIVTLSKTATGAEIVAAIRTAARLNDV